MSDNPHLNQTISSLQQRWGPRALYRANQLRQVGSWPTGMPFLDLLVEHGGLPRGKITSIFGSCCCGKTSLSQMLLASHTIRSSATVVHIDLALNLDPWYLGLLGADLSRLYVLRPASSDDAALAIRKFAESGTEMISIHIPARLTEDSRWDQHLPLINAAAERGGAMVLANLETSPQGPWSRWSSLNLEVIPGDWVWENHQLVGLRSTIRCLKNKLGTGGSAAELTVHYPLGPRLTAQTAARVKSPEAARDHQFTKAC